MKTYLLTLIAVVAMAGCAMAQSAITWNNTISIETPKGWLNIEDNKGKLKLSPGFSLIVKRKQQLLIIKYKGKLCAIRHTLPFKQSLITYSDL